MLNIKPPDYKYCPFCGKILSEKVEEGTVRMYCPNDNWTYFPTVTQAANAVIIKESKVLLVRRGREPYKGKWMFPAGFLNYGEHPEECVIREVKEETGLDAINPVFIDILQTTDDPRVPGNLSFYYKVEVIGNIANGDKEENSDIRWFDLHNLPPIAWIDHKKFLQNLQKEYS